MTEITGNFGLTKPAKEDFYNIEVQNENMEVIDQKLKELENSVDQVQDALDSHVGDYKLQIPWGGTTTNSGNAYSLAAPTISALTAGMAICFKCNADATGAVTLNWSGKGAKGVFKANGTAVTNWKNSGIYTVRFDGANFQLQGEGGEYGNVTAANVSNGVTFGTEYGIQTGTNTNKRWACGNEGSLSVSGVEKDLWKIVKTVNIGFTASLVVFKFDDCRMWQSVGYGSFGASGIVLDTFGHVVFGTTEVFGSTGGFGGSTVRAVQVSNGFQIQIYTRANYPYATEYLNVRWFAVE